MRTALESGTLFNALAITLILIALPSNAATSCEGAPRSCRTAPPERAYDWYRRKGRQVGGDLAKKSAGGREPLGFEVSTEPMPYLPDPKQVDFWEGSQWDLLGFSVQYMWAFGVFFSVSTSSLLLLRAVVCSTLCDVGSECFSKENRVHFSVLSTPDNFDLQLSSSMLEWF
jgi:opacity protein-like surface antigen